MGAYFIIMVQTMTTEIERLQLQLDALTLAEQSNVLSVRYGTGEQVTYRSSADLSAAMYAITRRRSELRRVGAGHSRHGISVARFSLPR